MTENQPEAQPVDEREEMYERQYHLASELKDRGIRKEYWEAIMEGAEGFKSVAKLDEYLDRMEANHSKFL